MKVFMCKRYGGYSGGLAVVAANTRDEAFEVFHHNEENKYMMSTKGDSYYYPRSDWFEVPILTADTIVPTIIEEGGYTE